MPTQKTLILLSLTLTGSVLLALYLAASARERQRPMQEAPFPPPVVPDAKIAGTAEICRFWNPWLEAFQPHGAEALMETLSDRVRQRAERSERFKVWVRSKPKSEEHVCAVGTDKGGVFTLDLFTPGPACVAGPSLFDFAIDMQVAPGRRSRRNSFRLHVTTDTFSPARMRTLIAAQSKLVASGYRGWEMAFPNFGDLNRSGIGISHEVSATASPETAAVESRIFWDPQFIWRGVPLLATWLFNLGSIVSIDTAISNADGDSIAKIHTGTKSLASTLHISLPTDGFMLPTNAAIDISVAHDVTIDFKGLIVRVLGLRFTGTLDLESEEMTYSGEFAGIDSIEVSGIYKGLSAIGVDEMLKDMIKDAITQEAQNLKSGNDGKGWVIRARFGPAGVLPDRSEFTLEMDVEAPVHVTELVRYESDEAASQVLPGRGESYEFGVFADAVALALLADARTFACP